MRIACLHIPQFSLQCVTRVRRSTPALIDAAIAVACGPTVLACSRAAWALWARVGMTAAAARTLSPDLEIVSADAQLERDTVRAIADAMLAHTAVVDLGGRTGNGAHLA